MPLSVPVQTPSDLALDTYFTEAATLGAASIATRKSVIPASPATRVTIGMYQNSGTAPVSQGIYVVFNSVSDGDADLALTRSFGRVFIPVGRSRTFNFDASSPCKRIDIIAEASVRSTPANETAGFLTTFDIGMVL